jgi:phosphosulfolactate phosphohydrolase-like enzyme
MTATQDERLSSRVFNSDVAFCSKAEAFSYVVLHRRDPDEQKTEVPTSVSDKYQRC